MRVDVRTIRRNYLVRVRTRWNNEYQGVQRQKSVYIGIHSICSDEKNLRDGDRKARITRRKLGHNCMRHKYQQIRVAFGGVYITSHIDLYVHAIRFACITTFSIYVVQQLVPFKGLTIR